MGFWSTVAAVDTLQTGLASWTEAATQAHSVAVFGLIPGFVTPDGALDHMGQVRTQLAALVSDVNARMGEGVKFSFFDALNAFVAEWNRFYSENEGFAARFMAPGEIDHQTTVYEGQLKHFYDLYAVEAKRPASMPAPVPQGAGDAFSRGIDHVVDPKPPGAGPSGIEWAFYAAAGIAGVASVGYLLNAIKR